GVSSRRRATRLHSGSEAFVPERTSTISDLVGWRGAIPETDPAQFFRCLATDLRVTIAAVQGIAADGGLELTLGFEANVQMRTQHVGPQVGAAKVRGTPHNQGDGLRMAMNIGAMPWGQWSGCKRRHS